MSIEERLFKIRPGDILATMNDDEFRNLVLISEKEFILKHYNHYHKFTILTGTDTWLIIGREMRSALYE